LTGRLLPFSLSGLNRDGSQVRPATIFLIFFRPEVNLFYFPGVLGDEGFLKSAAGTGTLPGARGLKTWAKIFAWLSKGR
jgi:hypothetical protein